MTRTDFNSRAVRTDQAFQKAASGMASYFREARVALGLIWGLLWELAYSSPKRFNNQIELVRVSQEVQRPDLRECLALGLGIALCLWLMFWAFLLSFFQDVKSLIGRFF